MRWILFFQILLLATACNKPQLGSVKVGNVEVSSFDSIVINASNISLNEGDTAVLVWTLSSPALSDFNLTISISGTNAAVNFPTLTKTIAVFRGQTTISTSINTNDNLISDGNRSFILSFSADVSTVSASPISFSLLDNDVASVVGFATSSSNALENAGSSSITLTSSPVSSSALTINYTVTPGSASSADFTFNSGSIIIPANASSANLTATILNDALIETPEDVVITLTSVSGASASLGTTTTHTLSIIDDDFPNITISDASVTEGAATNLTVSLSTMPTGPVTFDWTTVDGSATSASGYTAASGSITITPPAMSATINVSSQNNTTVCQASSAFQVVLSNVTGATSADLTGSVTITDNDRPTLQFTSMTSSLNENASGTLVASLSAICPTQTVSFTYRSQDGTAKTASPFLDYVAISTTTGTINPGSTTANISINALADSIYEGNEFFTVTLDSATNASLGAVDTNSVTISDLTTAPTLMINNISLTEGNSGTTSANFTVTASAVSALPITVNWATANGTATVADSDYTSDSGTVTISAGSTTANISIDVTGDAKFEAGETLIVNLSGGSGYTVAGSDLSGAGTITNDDTSPTISVNDVTINEDDAGTTTATFTVTPSSVSGVAISGNYAASNGSATTADSDFSASSGTFTIPANSASTTFTVTINGDTKFEPNETFNVTLSSVTGHTAAGSDLSGVGTITNDDSSPTISIADVSVNEGDTGTTAMTFTVTASAASGVAITGNYASSNGTATTADSDYATAASTFTIPAGSTSTIINVNLIGDTKLENDETINMTLSSVAGHTAAGSDLVAVGTITNDDTAPTISIADVSISEGNSGTKSATFTVTSSAVSALPITVDWATSNGTATVADSDYAVGAGSATITAGATTSTFTVTINGDVKFELNETFDLTLSDGSGYTVAGSDLAAIGTITNDDSAPTISVNDVTVTEGDAGTTTATFTVTSSTASVVAITGNWATSNGTATTADSDYAAGSGTFTIAPGSTSTTFNVNINGDSKFETNENFNVTLSSVTGHTAAGSDLTGVGTMTNDDTAPTISIADVSVSEGNSGSTSMTFTIAPAAVSGIAITGNWASSNGTATTADSDYAAASGTFTIAADSASTTVTVNLTGDTKYEADETLNVTLSSVTGHTAAGSDLTASGTITNDDSPPQLYISSVTTTGAFENVSPVITFALSSASVLPVTFDIGTSTGGATAPGDFTLSATSLTIPAGSTSVTLTVNVVDESEVDEDETVIIFPTNIVSASTDPDVDPQVIYSIWNNDFPNFTWKGGGGNNNWTNGANWIGNAAPGSGDVASFFQRACSSCSPTVNAAVNVGGINMRTGFSGIITQGNFAMTVRSSGWTQKNGQFNGSTTGAAITINSALTISGGNFRTTTGTLLIQPLAANTVPFNVTASGGFSRTGNNAAVVEIRGDATYNTTYGIVTPSSSFALYNLILSTRNGTASEEVVWEFATGSGIDCAKDLTIARNSGSAKYRLDGGTIRIGGNAVIGAGMNGGSGILVFDGTTAGTIESLGGGIMPELKFSKSGTGSLSPKVPTAEWITERMNFISASTSATLTFPTNLTVKPRRNEFLYNPLTVNTALPVLPVRPNLYFDLDCSLATSYYTSQSTFGLNFQDVSVVFTGTGCTDNNFRTGNGSILSVYGNFLIKSAGGGHRLELDNTNFTLDVYGNVTFDGTTRYTTHQFGKLAFRGSSDQTVYFTNGGENIFQDSWIVNKTAGSVQATSDLNLGNPNLDMTLTSGKLKMSGYTLTVGGTLSGTSAGELNSGCGLLYAGIYAGGFVRSFLDGPIVLNTDGTKNATFALDHENLSTVSSTQVVPLGGKVYIRSNIGLNSYNANASINTNFTLGTITGALNKIISTPTGGLFLAGPLTYNGTQTKGVAKISNTGALDTNFSLSISTDISPHISLASGDLLATTIFSDNDPEYPIFTTTFKKFFAATGAEDPTFLGEDFLTSSNSSPVPSRVLELSSGKILITGVFFYNNISVPSVFRVDSDGTFDNTFSSVNYSGGQLHAIDEQADGKIILGGTFTSLNGSPVNKLVRLNSTGSIDVTFDTGTGFSAGSLISSVYAQSDGKIVVGGLFTSYRGTPIRSGIIRLNYDGTLDNTFSVSGRYPAVSSIETDGTLYYLGRSCNGL